MNRYDFGNRLCELRRAHGYTQQKLGKMLGVSNKAVSKWENGESMPRLQMLDKIAACFDLSVDELLSYGDVKRTDEESVNRLVGPDTEAITSSKINMKLLMDFGWIKIDEKSVINEIKTEYGIGNRKLADFIGTSERKIGLWENGLERPSAKYCIRLAAFYRLNCEGGEGVDALVDARHELGKELNIFKLGVPVLMLLFFLMYIIFSVGDKAIYFMDNKVAPEFSLTYLFVVAIPLGILLTVSILFYLDMVKNRPNLSPVLHRIRLFFAVIGVYFAAMIPIFRLGKLVALSFAFLVLSYFLMRLLLRFYIKYELWDILVILWVLGNAIVITEVCIVYIDNYVYSGCYACFLCVSAIYLFLLAYDLLMSGVNNYYDRLKTYLGFPESEYKPLTKKEVLRFLPIIPATVCLFLIIEIVAVQQSENINSFLEALFDKIDLYFMT